MQTKRKIQVYAVILIDKLIEHLESLHSRWTLRNLGNVSKKHLLRLRYRDDRIRYMNAAWLEADGIYRSEKSPTPDNLSAIIAMEYHRIEKGLSLPNRRVGSSQDVIPRLIQAIAQQLDSHGPSDEGATSLATLDAYLNETPSEYLNQDVLNILTELSRIKDEYVKRGWSTSFGGYRIKNASEISQSLCLTSESFFRTRHSVRDYDQREVNEETIRKLTDIAMTSPSVCNRQAWRLYAITDKETIIQALSFQNGNRGFTERIPLLFVVTADQSRFVSVEERNQGWIDGGLFSMTLMLAMHAEGLGSCPLNWSASRENDTGLRNLLGIPEQLSVVMLISAGYLPESFKATCSSRKSVDSILEVVSN